MNPMAKSGLYYPNRFALISLKALTEVVGKNGMDAVYRMAQLPHLIDHLPPDNDAREFDFSDFSTLFQTLSDLFGDHGSRGLAIRAGRATFTEGIKVYGSQVGADDLPQRGLPFTTKALTGLKIISALFNQLSDQVTAVEGEEGDGQCYFIVEHCAVCHGRTSPHPVCAFIEGLLDEALFYFSGGSRFEITEVNCAACGGDQCRFQIQIPKPDNPPFTV